MACLQYARNKGILCRLNLIIGKQFEGKTKQQEKKRN